VVAGGVEASLRRIAHYDYWSDTVRRSIILDSKADLVVFGMGERTILDVALGLAAGRAVKDLRDLRGIAYRLGASEPPPSGSDTLELPSHELVAADTLAFCEMTRISHLETNPHNARRLVQRHGREAVVVNPPALPLEQDEMDQVYGLPFTRRPHPSYGAARIPAFEVVENSVQIMRGCFGGCTFCSITAHEGRIIQSRSQDSVITEIKLLAKQPGFKGTVSDIGGPTANMYQMQCTRPEVEAKCRRLSCVHPTVCKLLGTDHGPLKSLMREARSVEGVKRVLVASGVRMDLARRDPEYLQELAEHHVGGHLKVAPEHTDPEVLSLMKKPSADDYVEFDKAFKAASRRVGKKQFTVPYFIASHPGSGVEEMIDLAIFLKRNSYKPDQVQDFIPSPFDIAACMYYTGLDPMTKEPVKVTKGLKDRRMQRALLQFFKPENWFEVRRALLEAGRAAVENAYGQVVRPAGNSAAQRQMAEVFAVVDQPWRGLGVLPGSGLALRGPYRQLDARERFALVGAANGSATAAAGPCISGLILRGLASPPDCSAFAAGCTPEHPLGAPMVSSEGACAAYFRYRPPVGGQ
jgi:uncharacterized radical SAM protein YgiQ